MPEIGPEIMPSVYEAENDQLIGRLIEIEKLQGVIRLLQTQIIPSGMAGTAIGRCAN